jgi:hypothetical protein
MPARFVKIKMSASASASFASHQDVEKLCPRQTDWIRTSGSVLSEKPAKAPTTIIKLLPPHDFDNETIEDEEGECKNKE